MIMPDSPGAVEARAYHMLRAGEALVRALGGATVVLRVPVSSATTGTQQQLGIATGQVDDISLYPVVVRRIPPPKAARKKDVVSGQYEFLLPSSIVLAQAELRNCDQPEDLFTGAIGIMFQDRLLRITDVGYDYFAGMTYLYRVAAEG